MIDEGLLKLPPCSMATKFQTKLEVMLEKHKSKWLRVVPAITLAKTDVRLDINEVRFVWFHRVTALVDGDRKGKLLQLYYQTLPFVPALVLSNGGCTSRPKPFFRATVCRRLTLWGLSH